MGDYYPQPNGTMPAGSKIWLLDLGRLDCDEGVLVRSKNTFAATDTETKHTRRLAVMICVMIYHPDIGLILYDTGSPEDVIKNWKAEDLECTPRIWEKEKHGLPEAIAATGNKIEDVKVVILSHMHMDHAGGLEHFIGTGKQLSRRSILSLGKILAVLCLRNLMTNLKQILRSGSTNKNSNLPSGNMRLACPLAFFAHTTSPLTA
jgi:hypothetical protein